jgi:hypothetical protein
VRAESHPSRKKIGDYAFNKQVPIGAYLKHEERAIDHSVKTSMDRPKPASSTSKRCAGLKAFAVWFAVAMKFPSS